MALSNDAVVLVLKALKGITGNPNQCFTAYDVTKATRSLTDDNVRHLDVREVIHTFYDQGFLNLYTRQAHTFWSDAEQDYQTAQLFVPPNGDPSLYDPDEVQMVKDDSDNDAVLLQDSDGNPLITTGAVPAIAMKADNTADATIDIDDNNVIDAPNLNVTGTVTGRFSASAPNAPAPPQQKKDSLFDLITKKLTKLPKLW